MDVSNDPFPRDEVTGLAAFENLEPISALNVMPPEPEPTLPPPQFVPGVEPSAAPADARAARTFARPLGVPPAQTVAREDRTEILDLDKVTHVREEAPKPEPEEDNGWENEATSILSASALQPAATANTSPAASLEMDWDEDEPPTRMREDLAFLPPLTSAVRTRRDADGEWEHEHEDEAPAAESRVEAAGYPSGDLPVPVPAPPLGRPSPFPAAQAASSSGRAYLAPIAQPVARGGAPSPFTSAALEPEEKPAGSARPAWMLIAAGAAVAIVLVGLGRLLFGGSSDATVTLTTTPSDARVFIDSKPVSGTSSPFSMGELKEGLHELVVQKDGFIEHRSTFNLESGESRTLPAVELKAKKLESGFTINSVPAGAAIALDGVPTGKVTPAQINEVPPGMHKLELSLNGHAKFELQVLVPENAILQLPVAQLAATSGSARSARAERAERSERSDKGSGDEPRRRAPRGDSASAPVEPVAHAAAPIARSAAPIAAPASRAAASGGATGMLRLNSRPWSQVYVDGQLVGNTPQMGLSLNPGNHSVRLVNSQMGLTKTFSVQIKAGQMVTKVINLVE